MPESHAPMPKLLYGTAWKKERTQPLVEQAVRCGFRGIDTARILKTSAIAVGPTMSIAN